MKGKVEVGGTQGATRRELIQGIATAVGVVGTSAKLFAYHGVGATPAHEPNDGVFNLLTFWLATTNDNAALNKLDDATLSLMGLDPSDFGAARKYVERHPTTFKMIREEFHEISRLYNSGYQPGECPKFADTLKPITKLPVPK